MVEDPAQIPVVMQNIVSDPANYLFALSAITVWEVAKR